MAQRPQPSLRLADGGSFITRWAQSVMRPNATAKRLREADAPPPPPAAPVRAPAPPPPNPNATPDNPAGIRFQDGGTVDRAAGGTTGVAQPAPVGRDCAQVDGKDRAGPSGRVVVAGN